MTDYKAMYLYMAGKMADAVELLIRAQREAEEMYISADLIEPDFPVPTYAGPNEEPDI